MKETVLDVLMYLFEHYFDDEVVLGPDHEILKRDLIQEGFPQPAVDKAFIWLEGLAADEDAVVKPYGAGPSKAMRHYTREEEGRLGADARGFLLFLEQVGVLNPTSREVVIDQVLALESEDIEFEQVKWVVQMVLFNRPDREGTFTSLENLVFAETRGHMH